MAHYTPTRFAVHILTYKFNTSIDYAFTSLRFKDTCTRSEQNALKSYSDTGYRTSKTVILDNKPLKGYIVNAHSSSIMHPLGYIFCVSQNVINNIIDTCRIDCGVIENELIMVEKDSTSYFTPLTSEIYLNSDKTTKEEMFGFDKLVSGDVFVKSTGETVEFLGRFEGLNLMNLCCTLKNKGNKNTGFTTEISNNFTNHDERSNTLYICRKLSDEAITLETYNKVADTYYSSTTLNNLVVYKKSIQISKVLFNTGITKETYFNWLRAKDWNNWGHGVIEGTAFVSTEKDSTFIIFDTAEESYTSKNVFSTPVETSTRNKKDTVKIIKNQLMGITWWYFKDTSGKFIPSTSTGMAEAIPSAQFEEGKTPIVVLSQQDKNSLSINCLAPEKVYSIKFTLDRSKKRV